MLKNKKGFTLIELLVVIAIIAMLLSIMMPALGKAKKLAQTVLCKANLHQWMYIWVLYTDDHDGKFPGGNVGGGQQNWYNLLADLYEDQADVRFCPTAQKQGGVRPFNAWYRSPTGDPYDPENSHNWRSTGSYGINNFMHTNTRDSDYRWGTTDVPNPRKVPVFGDTGYWKVGGGSGGISVTDAFPENESSAIADSGTTGGLTLLCLDRHDGYTHWLFLDWSVKAVGLKKLWSDDVWWHRKWKEEFDRDKLPEWPQWMKHMPDKIK